MVLYLDLDSLEFRESLAGGAKLTRCLLKRGDTAALRVQFVRGWATATLADGALVRVGIKESGKFDGEFLAYAEDLTEPVGPATEYTGDLSINTEAINLRLKKNGDAGDDLAALACLLEVTWSEDDGAKWLSSVSLPTTLANDVVRGDEGTPLALPTPDTWLDERAVRYDKAQTLSDAEKLQARDNIGATGGAGASGDMLAATYDPTSVSGDAFDMANMAEAADAKVMTAAERAKLANQSGVNTGDQDLSPYETTTQLNARDTANRARANHTGTQTLASISDAGGAAALDVGTTPGTVAAGDDSRLSDKREIKPASYADPNIIIDGGLL